MASSRIETALAFLRATFENDYDTLLPLVADGFALIDHPEGIEYRTDEEHAAAMEADIVWADRAFDLTHAMETADGAVVLQYIEQATQVGVFHGIEPTGKTITADVCNIFRFDTHGRVVELEVYEDLLGITRQLGGADLP